MKQSLHRLRRGDMKDVGSYDVSAGGDIVAADDDLPGSEGITQRTLIVLSGEICAQPLQRDFERIVAHESRSARLWRGAVVEGDLAAADVAAGGDVPVADDRLTGRRGGVLDQRAGTSHEVGIGFERLADLNAEDGQAVFVVRVALDVLDGIGQGRGGCSLRPEQVPEGADGLLPGLGSGRLAGLDEIRDRRPERTRDNGGERSNGWIHNFPRDRT